MDSRRSPGFAARVRRLDGDLLQKVTDSQHRTARAISGKRLVGYLWARRLGGLRQVHQCNPPARFGHLLRRCESLFESGIAGALAFPRAGKGLWLKGFEYRNRMRKCEISAYGLKMMPGRLTTRMSDLVRPINTQSANDRLAKLLERHLDSLFTFFTTRVPIQYSVVANPRLDQRF